MILQMFPKIFIFGTNMGNQDTDVAVQLSKLCYRGAACGELGYDVLQRTFVLVVKSLVGREARI